MQQLRDAGFSHLALPVLALADVVVRQLMSDASLLSLVHLKSMEVCVELNLTPGIAFHWQMVDIKLHEDDVIRYSIVQELKILIVIMLDEAGTSRCAFGADVARRCCWRRRGCARWRRKMLGCACLSCNRPTNGNRS